MVAAGQGLHTYRRLLGTHLDAFLPSNYYVCPALLLLVSPWSVRLSSCNLTTELDPIRQAWWSRETVHCHLQKEEEPARPHSTATVCRACGASLLPTQSKLWLKSRSYFAGRDPRRNLLQNTICPYLRSTQCTPAQPSRVDGANQDC